LHRFRIDRVKDFGKPPMLQATTFVTTQPTPEAERIGVYVLAAICGLLVCGVISVIKELREETASRP
jgi:hypothetical protein